VLLVDDAPANIQIVNSILKEIYKIRVATSGAKALELAKISPRPDLVLLDVMLPDINGLKCVHS
jgi:CheY-like chemotaxis protein